MDLEELFERAGLGRDKFPQPKPPAVEEKPVLPRYMVIHGNDPQDLAIKVNIKMIEGWRLHGGVAIACHYNSLVMDAFKYAQAVIRE